MEDKPHLDHKDLRQILYSTPYYIVESIKQNWPELACYFDFDDTKNLEDLCSDLKSKEFEINELIKDFFDYVEDAKKKMLAEYEE